MRSFVASNVTDAVSEVRLICFMRGGIRFLHNKRNHPIAVQGQAFGNYAFIINRFVAELGQYGFVVIAIGPGRTGWNCRENEGAGSAA